MAKINFDQKPAVALKYLTQKQPSLHFDYDEIMHEAHHKAFTVAKVTKLDLLTDIQKSLIKARDQGQPFEAWKKELIPTLKKKGWYGKTEVTNPKTGEIKEIYVGSRRLRNIFYTNTRVAYNVGRWQHQDQLEDAPYLRYVAILDNRNRPSHGKNHGVVRHKDDAFWTTNYPPNGWNCRCRVQAYSMESLKRRGWDKGLKAPVHNVADKDWAYDVRTGSRARVEAYADKRVKSAPKALGAVVAKDLIDKNYKIRKKELLEMVDELIVKGNKKYERTYIDIGIFSAVIVKNIRKLLGLEVEDLGVVLEKNRLLHASPTRKDAYGHAFRVEEFKQIVDVVDDEDDVYVDTRENKEAIIYIFADKEDENKVNKIIVQINRTVKRFKDEAGNKIRTNGVVTLDKVKKEDFENDIKKGYFKKVDKKI